MGKKHFLAQIEEEILEKWEKEQTFSKSLKNREGGELFSFYDGPPYANGMPHYGHFVQTTIKDSMTRYKTMRGYWVPRRVGWDTHGLPIEYAIEKEHEFNGKQDIVKYGISKFNAECRESVFKYKDIWEKTFRRAGRWADYANSYATLDSGYIESVWWVFKTIYDKGLVYKDFRSSPYCPRCATPLSNFELNQGYQDDIADPSLFVKFKVVDQDAFLLGWTTTPWSLPGNSAIAVKAEAIYVYVKTSVDGGKPQTLILAKDRLEILDQDDYRIVKEVKGSDLVGLGYEPLFAVSNLNEGDNQQNLYKVYPADFVSIQDGSGVLHVAPAFGEDDLTLSKKHSIPVLITVDEYGKITKGIGLPKDIEGLFFKKADNKIIQLLTENERVYSAQTLRHTYPFCWRCDTPLLYYATDSWMVDVTAIGKQLVATNQSINWIPGHIRDGRFGKWLEGARDWAISRNRFWGAPIPIWQTDDGEIVVIGSIEELKELAVDKSQIDDLHRPFIDDVQIKTKSGKIAKRIPEVFDVWFESGAMPYAQDHYPFENKKQWEAQFPADFIAEAVDQTRGWFYTLHVLAGALFDKPAFKNVITSGWVVAADGEKLSKRKKNYAPMDDVFDQFGVDTLRFFMASSPIVNGEDVRFSVDYLRDVQRKVFMTLNNTYSFYKLYADVDKWHSKDPLQEPKSDNILDKWVVSRLNQTIEEVTSAMEDYRLDRATRPLVSLLDDVSNWYVRRSRRRFWKSEDDIDKRQAYQTLQYVLLRTCQLLAPFSPFLTDHLWDKLSFDTNLPPSVHLSDWPSAGTIDALVVSDMQLARDYITEGLAQRAIAKVKVRQPLNTASVPQLPELYRELIAEELNVKSVVWGEAVVLDTKVSDSLELEGIMRDLIRHIQNARKQADLNVDDRIILEVRSSDKKIEKALETYQENISQETLAVSINKGQFEADFVTEVKIDEKTVALQLKRA